MVECERETRGSHWATRADEVRLNGFSSLGEPPAGWMRTTRGLLEVASLSDRMPRFGHSPPPFRRRIDDKARASHASDDDVTDRQPDNEPPSIGEPPRTREIRPHPQGTPRSRRRDHALPHRSHPRSHHHPRLNPTPTPDTPESVAEQPTGPTCRDHAPQPTSNGGDRRRCARHDAKRSASMSSCRTRRTRRLNT